MYLKDVATMNPKASMGNESSGNYSVSKKLVYFGMPRPYLREADNHTIASVCCIVHGAMMAVSKMYDGNLLYRCEVCNNGAILEK